MKTRMHFFVLILFLLAAPMSAMAQTTLDAPPPGAGPLGIPETPHRTSEGKIAADDAAKAAAPADTPATPDTSSTLPAPPDAAPAPGDGITVLAPQDGPRSVQDIDPTELPKELLDEMESVEKECSRNTFYSAFHDCRCVAVKYLDERIKRGPYAVRNIIMNDIASQCPNSPGIAGYVYRNCIDYMSWTRPDYEEFCRCSANLTAERYSKNPRMNNRYIETVRRDAMLQCGMAPYGSTPNPEEKPIE